MIFDLLPRGLAWPRERGTNLDNLITAEAVELTRVDRRVADMITESYPLTSGELLPDWERVTGLPDPCVGTPDTVQKRREAVNRKLGATGGQSINYYIDVAARAGYTVTITEYTPFRVGLNAMGDPLASEDWAYAWQVNAPAETVRVFRAGQGSAGEALRTWGNEILECALNQVKPAHTYLIFAYGTAE